MLVVIHSAQRNVQKWHVAHVHGLIKFVFCSFCWFFDRVYTLAVSSAEMLTVYELLLCKFYCMINI